MAEGPRRKRCFLQLDAGVVELLNDDRLSLTDLRLVLNMAYQRDFDTNLFPRMNQEGGRINELMRIAHVKDARSVRDSLARLEALGLIEIVQPFPGSTPAVSKGEKPRAIAISPGRFAPPGLVRILYAFNGGTDPALTGTIAGTDPASLAEPIPVNGGMHRRTGSANAPGVIRNTETSERPNRDDRRRPRRREDRVAELLRESAPSLFTPPPARSREEQLTALNANASAGGNTRGTA